MLEWVVENVFDALYIMVLPFLTNVALNGKKCLICFADLSVTQVQPTSPQRVRDIRIRMRGVPLDTTKGMHIEDSLERI